jgi:hypothetical protein
MNPSSNRLHSVQAALPLLHIAPQTTRRRAVFVHIGVIAHG